MKKARMIIDLMMTAILPMLMAYSLIGENAHEVLGLCMFALFIAHHAMNRKWWTTLFKGRYNAVRILNTAVNLFLAVFMFLQPVTGILMSKYVLTGIRLNESTDTIRTLHMTLAYWGFIMMSFHLGLHFRQVSARFRKHISTAVRRILMVAFLAVAACGVYAFVKRGIWDYLTMQVMFAFFDYSEPVIWFLLDYLSVMVLMAEAGFWLQNVLMKTARKKASGLRRE